MGRCPHSTPAEAGKVVAVAVAALLPVVHLLQVSHLQTTFSPTGFAQTLFPTVVTGTVSEQHPSSSESKGRSKAAIAGYSF